MTAKEYHCSRCGEKLVPFQKDPWVQFKTIILWRNSVKEIKNAIDTQGTCLCCNCSNEFEKFLHMEKN